MNFFGLFFFIYLFIIIN